MCQPVGASSADTPCDGANEIGTACVDGYACIDNGGQGRCRKVCDFFAGAGDCPSGQQCTVFDRCLVDATNGVDLDAACEDTEIGEFCGSDGERALGVCVNEGTSSSPDAWCRALCRLGQADCGRGKACTEPGVGNLGACL